MIQSIIDGIVAALVAAFPKATIYDETVKQGVKIPCFIVDCISPTNNQFLGGRYKRTNLFSVKYISESDIAAKAECNAVLETLYQVLEYITVNGDLTRGTDMKGAYLLDELNFQVNYNMFVSVLGEEKPTFESYNLETPTVQ